MLSLLSLTRVTEKGAPDVKLAFAHDIPNLVRFHEERAMFHLEHRKYFEEGLQRFVRAQLEKSMVEAAQPSIISVQRQPSSGSGEVKAEGEDDDASEHEMSIVFEQGLYAKDTAIRAHQDTRHVNKNWDKPINSDTRLGEGEGGAGKRRRDGAGRAGTCVKKQDVGEKSKRASNTTVNKRLQEYKELTKNYVPPATSTVCKQHKQDVARCGCSNGDCTDSNACKNHGLQHECGMGKCLKQCRNVGGLQDPRILPETYVAPSPISGEGLFASEDIEQGTEIRQYLGKVLTGEMLAEAMEERGEMQCGTMLHYSRPHCFWMPPLTGT